MRWEAIGKRSGRCDIAAVETIFDLKSGAFVAQIDEEKVGDIIFLKKM